MFACTKVSFVCINVILNFIKGIDICLQIGLYVVSLVGPTGVNPLDCFYSCIQLYILLSPYLYFISILYLDLYLPGDDRSTS